MIKTTAAVIVSVAISTGITYYMTNPIKERLSYTPKVAVVDFIRMGDDLFFNPSATDKEKEEVKKQIELAKDNLEILKDAGYLVLDKSKVLATPDFTVQKISK